MNSYKPTRSVKTADRIFSIIHLLQELEGAGVTELADHLDLAKSTIHHHLATLESEGYVVNEDGKYRLSLKFLDQGMFVRNNMEVLHAVQSPLSQLARETSEMGWFIVEEHGQAVYLDSSVGEHGIQTHGRIGARTNLHCLAAGKAILAYLPKKHTQRIIDRYDLTAHTEHTITEPEVLFEELEQIRNRNGIAFCKNEKRCGVSGAGAPILRDGCPIGAISVSGPTDRIKNQLEDEIPHLLSGATNAAELRLESSINQSSNCSPDNLG